MSAMALDLLLARGETASLRSLCGFCAAAIAQELFFGIVGGVNLTNDFRASRVWCFLAGSLALLSAQPVDVILTLETSAGTEQAIGLIRPRVFQPGDRAAVIGFTNRAAQVLQPLTNDREALASALQRAGIRVGVGIGGVQINSSWTADLVGAIQQACEELQRSELSERKRAVVVLFGSDDPELRTHLETLKAALSAANARLYAVVIDRSAGERGSPPGRQVRILQPFPALTAQLMAKLAEDSGGRIFRRGWELKDILKELR